MKRFFSIVALAALLFSACKDEKFDNGDNEKAGSGVLSLKLTPSGAFVDPGSKAGEEVDVKDFVVVIANAESGAVAFTSKYSEFPNVLSLPKGSYKITASSPGVLPAAFDQPIYKGGQSFSVEASKLSTLNVVCTLSNMKVTIDLTDQFLAEMTDFEVVVSTPSGAQLVFDSSNIGAAGYFEVAPLTIHVSGKRKADNSEISQTATLTEVAAQDYHQISMNAVETGNTQLGITIDATTNNKETTIVIPGEDEEAATTPTITGDGIESPLTVSDAEASTKSASVVAATPDSKIAKLKLEFDSPALTEAVLTSAGLAKTMDLAHITSGSAQETALKNLGLLGTSGSAAILDQTTYTMTVGAALLAMLPSSDAGTVNHNFILTVTDANGYSTSKIMTIARVKAAAATPTITGDGVGTILEISDEQAGNSPTVNVVVTTPQSTISELWVELDSPALDDATLAAVGLPRKFDLANLEAGSELETFMRESLHLIPADGSSIKTLDTYTFSVGSFMGLLTSDPEEIGLDPGNYVDHKFHVTVKAANGQEKTETLTVRRKIE
ncbi:MAG: DUF4493 domain-containing protein [Alistipes sp.]|nr:DUF4493 domain-containing protein [Alistipes sp.]